MAERAKVHPWHVREAERVHACDIRLRANSTRFCGIHRCHAWAGDCEPGNLERATVAQALADAEARVVATLRQAQSQHRALAKAARGNDHAMWVAYSHAEGVLKFEADAIEAGEHWGDDG